MTELDFTGERMVPAKVDAHLEFEHAARYRFAARSAQGAMVVDLGAGAGYGAEVLLAGGAERVVGLDVAADATFYAADRFGGPAAHFAVADCTRDCLRPGIANVVTAFEVIEHLRDYQALVGVAQRLLAEGGLFFVSTPNKSTYSDERRVEANPFHVKEFYYQEFFDLLSGFFPAIKVVGQSTTEGTLFRAIAENDSAAPPSVAETPSGERLTETADFFVAVCGTDVEAVERACRAEYLIAPDNLLRERTLRVHELQDELAERADWVRDLSDEAEVKTKRIEQLQAELEERARWAESLGAEVQTGGRRLAEMSEELAARQRRADELEAEAERQRREATQLRQELEQRLRVARRLKREVDERDRQFLARLRDLERLEAVTGQLVLDQRQADAHQAQVFELLQGVDDRMASRDGDLAAQQRLLGWQQESAILQARQAQALAKTLAVVEPLQAELERASYEHQRGLDHHSNEIGDLYQSLRQVGEAAADQRRAGQQLVGSQADLSARLETVLQSRPWRVYRALARLWRRLLGRERSVVPLAERFAEAAGNARLADRPAATLCLVIETPDEVAVEAVRRLAGLTGEGNWELVVAGVGAAGGLAKALGHGSAIAAVGGSAPAAGLRRALAAARGRHVAVLVPEVSIGGEDLARLFESFERLPRLGLVTPRLLDESDQLRVFGGGLDASGAPGWAGDGDEWDALALSFAQPTPFAPGFCLAADRDLLREVLAPGMDPFSLTAAAQLAAAARERGLACYVQPTASARLADAPRYAGASKVSVAAPAAAEGPRILIVDHRLPTPDQDSGSLRMLHLLTILNTLGFRVTLLPENLQAAQPYCRDLQHLGVEVAARPWVGSVRDFIASEAGRFDCAMICRFHIADEFFDDLKRAFDGKPVVFDTVDLQFLRESRRAELEEDAARAREAALLERRELAVCREADAALVVSDVERELLAERAPEASIRLVSNIHDVPGSSRGFFGRRDMFFIGGFEHPPNVDAVCWLVEEILPLVRLRIPGIKLHVIGSKPTPEVESLAGPNVSIEGFVADLAPFLDGCRLSVAPLRYGAGVKGKVNQSLAHGVPCVVTDAAAEGMGLVDGYDAMLAESAEDFANAIVRIHRNPWLWRRLSRNGIKNTRERFSIDVAREALKSLFDDLGVIGPDARA